LQATSQRAQALEPQLQLVVTVQLVLHLLILFSSLYLDPVATPFMQSKASKNMFS
jgi:hypothetical protein